MDYYDYYSYNIAGVPYDGSIVEIIHEHSVIMSGIYYSLGIIGLVFLLICLLVNIIFRKKKYESDY